MVTLPLQQPAEVECHIRGYRVPTHLAQEREALLEEGARPRLVAATLDEQGAGVEWDGCVPVGAELPIEGQTRVGCRTRGGLIALPERRQGLNRQGSGQRPMIHRCAEQRDAL